MKELDEKTYQEALLTSFKPDEAFIERYIVDLETLKPFEKDGRWFIQMDLPDECGNTYWIKGNKNGNRFGSEITLAGKATRYFIADEINQLKKD